MCRYGKINKGELTLQATGYLVAISRLCPLDTLCPRVPFLFRSCSGAGQSRREDPVSHARSLPLSHTMQESLTRKTKGSRHVGHGWVEMG